MAEELPTETCISIAIRCVLKLESFVVPLSRAEDRTEHIKPARR